MQNTSSFGFCFSCPQPNSGSPPFAVFCNAFSASNSASQFALPRRRRASEDAVWSVRSLNVLRQAGGAQDGACRSGVRRTADRR